MATEAFLYSRDSLGVARPSRRYHGRHRWRLPTTGVWVLVGAVAASVLPLTLPARAALQGEWSDAGNLDLGRMSHTATLLADGATVLVAGGLGDWKLCEATTCTTDVTNGSITTNSVEFYEDGLWRQGPPLLVPRREHVATLLDPAFCQSAPLPADYPCGSVLVVGGAEESQNNVSSSKPFSTAELYNPQAGTWQSCPLSGADHTCPDRLPRKRTTGHTATVLDGPACRPPASPMPAYCGKVLVVGGPLSDNTADLYDPRSGTWAAASSLPVASFGYAINHTATLLADGRVLVTGGDGHPRQSHLYNPAQDQWSATTDQLKVDRVYHTATLLPDGRVLVAGGIGTTGIGRSSAEVFDPDDGTWILKGSMDAPRAFHSAAVIGGQVLVVGGADRLGADPTDSAEVFDNGTWTATAGMGPGQERTFPSSMALAGGEVLVVGGRGRTGTGFASSTRLFRISAAPVPVVTVISPNQGSTAGDTEVTITGRGFVGFTEVRFGGVPATGAPRLVSDGEIRALAPRDQPPGTVHVQVVNTQGASPPIPASRYTYVNPVGWSGANGFTLVNDPAVTLLPGGHVLVAGGSPNRTRNRGPAQVWDPLRAAWTRTGSSARNHVDATATLLADGRVLLAGGSSGSVDSSPDAEVYDPSLIGVAPTESVTEIADVPTLENVQGGWAATAPMVVPLRQHHSATRLGDGSVLAVGGDPTAPGVGLATAERYHALARPATGWWSPAGTVNSALAGHTASLLPDGRVFVVGGCPEESCSTRPSGSTHVYDPNANSWSDGPAMVGPRAWHSATTLANGKVMVAGGCIGIDLPGIAGCTEPTATAEIYDPATRTWSPAAPLIEARLHHTGTLLPGGKLFVSGGVSRKGGEEVQLNSAELYDPVADSWLPAAGLLTRRDHHGAVALPEGPARVCGVHCGRVVVVGGVESSEVYAPAPEVSAVTPASGPTAGGTAVAIVGSGFAGVTGVGFGPFAAGSFAADPERPATRLVAVAPKHAPGVADVVVTTSPTAGVVLESAPALAGRFSYFAPDRPLDLVASVVSDTAIRLDFLAPDHPPATRYVVKQGASPLDTDEAFEAAPSLCGRLCDLSPEPGQPPADRPFLMVDGLTPGTTYHFALRAQRTDQTLGPRSASASATTSGVAPAPLPPLETGCRALGTVAAGAVAYPAGYSLVGLPAGTVAGSQSPLYGWLDLGAGGAYSSRAATEAVSGGRGYWAYFSCPKVVGPLPAGDSSARLPLGAYRASMVGNPSSAGPVSLSGHDYAATWDPSLNNGAGGYALSGYREPRRLAVGQGAWAFSYTDTTLRLGD